MVVLLFLFDLRVWNGAVDCNLAFGGLDLAYGGKVKHTLLMIDG